ncbi:MAG: DNA gyrase inhibitor YacG [Deltaproteobacteria bacterium]|nr:DNA gyrase inhibitor YacG [Deltaproteobacteria bacterium]
MTRKVLLCPKCKTPVAVEASLRPTAFPFCSDRCRAVDLGKWFGEEFMIPAPIDPDDHESIEAVIAARRGEG